MRKSLAEVAEQAAQSEKTQRRRRTACGQRSRWKWNVASPRRGSNGPTNKAKALEIAQAAWARDSAKALEEAEARWETETAEAMAQVESQRQGSTGMPSSNRAVATGLPRTERSAVGA